jgi:thymidylate synthase ThyX
VVIFEVIGASRALTHQLVRTRKAAFHQQSQRATWYGDRPATRFPLSVSRTPKTFREHAPYVELAWRQALMACWAAYKAACDAGVSYQDARYILPEGTANYIICEYPLREFLNVYAYRACSGFLWEMVHTMREMGRVLVEANPFLADYVKISCEKGLVCMECAGSGKVRLEPTNSGDIVGLAADADDPRAEDCAMCNGTTGRKCTFQGWENVEKFCDFPQAKQSNRTFLPNPKYRIGG